MSDVSSIIIEELDGSKRKVELKGPSLPFVGASWKSKHSVVTTWYPGNGAMATQHVLGPQEAPSSWEGVFRRTLMGKSPSTVTEGDTTSTITHPATMRDLLDEIFFTGVRLRVSWVTVAADGTRGSVVREGRATDWEFPTDRIHDIAWKVTFDWYGRGAVVQRVVATRDQDLGGANAQLVSAMEAAVLQMVDPFNTAHLRVPKAASRFNLGQLEALVAYPGKLVSEFTRNITKITSTLNQIGGIVNTAKNLPFAIANTALSSAQNSLAVSHQFYDALTRTPVELYTTRRKLKDISKTAEFFGKSVEQSQAIAANAHDLGVALRRPASSNMGRPVPAVKKGTATRASTVLAVHVVRAGENLVILSQRFYHSPDNAVDIAKANNLPWHIIRVAQGTVLMIPVLASQARL
jgi:hypothetical protein